jgi:hypothetical protein
VDTFQDSERHDIGPNGGKQDSGNMVTHIPKQKNLQTMFVQPKGMAKHDKRINPGV